MARVAALAVLVEAAWATGSGCVGRMDVGGIAGPSYAMGGGGNASQNRLTLKHNSGFGITKSCGKSWDPEGFQLFEVLGRTLSFTVDLSRVGCACNLALYFFQGPARDFGGRPSKGSCSYSPYYCDANQVCGQWCPEIDLMEANNRVFASTPHKCDAPSATGHYSNCDRGGCGRSTRELGGNVYGPGGGYTIDTTRAFDVHTTFHGRSPRSGTLAGASFTGMTTRLQQGGKQVVWDHPSCGGAYFASLTPAMAAGMAMRISYWGSDAGTMSWLDQPPCGAESCSATAGVGVIANMRVSGGAGGPPSPPAPIPAPAPPPAASPYGQAPWAASTPSPLLAQPAPPPATSPYGRAPWAASTPSPLPIRPSSFRTSRPGTSIPTWLVAVAAVQTCLLASVAVYACDAHRRLERQRVRASDAAASPGPLTFPLQPGQLQPLAPRSPTSPTSRGTDRARTLSRPGHISPGGIITPLAPFLSPVSGSRRPGPRFPGSPARN